MKKTLTTAILLSILLLSGCTDSSESSSAPLSDAAENSTSESMIQTTEPSQEIEPENDPITETIDEETKVETDEIFFYGPKEENNLMYNGELYIRIVSSQQVEIDGKYYELVKDDEESEPMEPFIDAERLKNESEYIGKSIPNPDGFALPTQELEVTLTHDSGDLYKIDENQILYCSTKEYEISDNPNVAVYPGTYKLNHIFLRYDAYEELSYKLVDDYYRYEERFPGEYLSAEDHEKYLASINTTEE